MARKNAFYAQSGGVTAVINASACGVLETAANILTRSAKSMRGATALSAP
jgi:6-phosphofructokinase 1